MNDTDKLNWPFKIGDRVRRSDNSGPLGTVQLIRQETARHSVKTNEGDTESTGLTVTVLWDNGTTSHFVPEGLVSE